MCSTAQSSLIRWSDRLHAVASKAWHLTVHRVHSKLRRFHRWQFAEPLFCLTNRRCTKQILNGREGFSWLQPLGHAQFFFQPVVCDLQLRFLHLLVRLVHLQRVRDLKLFWHHHVQQLPAQRTSWQRHLTIRHHGTQFLLFRKECLGAHLRRKVWKPFLLRLKNSELWDREILWIAGRWRCRLLRFCCCEASRLSSSTRIEECHLCLLQEHRSRLELLLTWVCASLGRFWNGRKLRPVLNL